MSYTVCSCALEDCRVNGCKMARIAEEIERRTIATPDPLGCICPPTSEQTCQNPVCPRKPISATGRGGKISFGE